MESDRWTRTRGTEDQPGGLTQAYEETTERDPVWGWVRLSSEELHLKEGAATGRVGTR